MPREDRLRELIDAYRAAAARGEPVSPDALCPDDPALADELRAAVGDLTRSLDGASTLARPASVAADDPTADAGATPAGQRAGSRSAPPPAIPGYVIEGELGRGGMGVVYLARQVSLKRPVALKMIRGGADALPEQLARFTAEAEAVAQLQHPNIVQIFEVGEQGGNPYFALEYVAGGSLANRMAAGPVPPAEAAALVETLARAVHHAHQKGIVHRDLKPGNVLLTPDGTPKVTDFGLAKRLAEADSARTRTGAVLGTPNYMAPEQAAGKTSQVGPATDVYALGVILYELLAGRVPFLGESVMDTLHRVLAEDPVPPSKLRPGVGRDLETICLRALAKEPARRYPSALALAQDLERFRSGEPILARREGPVRKAWRKVRKRWATVALASAAIAGVTVAAVVLSGSGAERRAAALTREFEDRLDAAHWPADHRGRLEQIVEELRPVAPDRAEAAARKLTDRGAERVREALHRPRIEPADVPALEGDIAWLAGRDAAAADRLRTLLADRLRGWQPLFELAPPFGERDAVFGPGVVKAQKEGLFAVNPAIITPARVRSAGPVRVEAEFAPEWWGADRAGVVVQFPGNPREVWRLPGYTFLVRAVPPPAPGEAAPAAKPKAGAKPDRPPRFEETGGHAEVAILRNGAALRRQAVALPRGPLRVAAERDGDRLRVQVNDLPPLTFTDPVPIVGGDRVFGVLWASGAAVTRLRAEARALPAAASPLERADDLFEQGRFADALPLYEAEARAAADPAAAAEPRCKAGMCLAALNRPDDAARAFEAAAAAPGDRWPAVAACHLWANLLREKKFDEAAAVAAALTVRYTRAQLAQYVPDHVRAEILAGNRLPAVSFVFPDPALVRRAESVAKLAELLDEPEGELNHRYTLAVALTTAGEYARAAAELRRILPDAVAAARASPDRSSWLLEWSTRLYGWVGPHGGEDRGAVSGRLWTALNETLAPDAAGREPGDALRRSTQPARFALARLAAASGDWARAEHLLAEADRTYPKPYLAYTHFSPRWLMAGFLADRKGDAEAARAAWRKGTYRAYQAQLPPDHADVGRLPQGRYDMVDAWVIGSLADDLPEAEAANIVSALVSAAAGDPLVGQMAGVIEVSPVAVRAAWRSPRAKELARRMAFLDLPPAEFFQAAPTVLGYEKARQDLFGGSPTPEQDEVAWQAVKKIGAGLFERKIGKSVFLNLGLTWGGTTGLFGWGGAAPKLSPDVRGPIAYLLGLRYLRMDPPRPKDAAAFFRTAAADAPPGSPLKTLAEEELAKLK